MTQAAVYVRVSTRQQVEQATIVSQLAAIEQYAQAHGHQLTADHIYRDEAVSGSSLNRPGLTRLRDATYLGAFSTILCLEADRLSRNLGVQQLLLEEWRLQQIDVIFVQSGQQAETPQDHLLLNIKGAFAEYERTVISDRMQRGKRHRLKTGQALPYPAPYGYHYRRRVGAQAGNWIVDDAQAAIVSLIYQWYIHDNLSRYAIAQRLNQQQTPAPTGGQWGGATVGRILKQPAYKGTAFYARTRSDQQTVGLPRKHGWGRLQSPREILRPPEEWISLQVPALLDDTIWEAAQRQRQMNTKSSSRNSRRPYLLRGLLVCGVCQRVLQGRHQKGRLTYRCPHGGKKRAADVPAHRCTIQAEALETHIWQELTNLLQHPQRLQEAWMSQQATQTPAADTTAWQVRQKTLTTQRQRLLDMCQVNVISLAELQKRLQPLENELKQLSTKLAAAEQRQHRIPDVDQFAKIIQQALDSTEFETQQEVIRLLIERIVIYDDEIVVEHIIPTIDESRLGVTHCNR